MRAAISSRVNYTERNTGGRLSHSLPIPRPFAKVHQHRGPSDEELVRAYLQGDHPAFNLLFERYRDRVIGYVWRLVRDQQEAEDIALESFCRVLEGAWKPSGSFRAFLFTVAHRLSIDKLRKRQRILRFERLWRATTQPARSPERAVVLDEAHRTLEEALASLPELHRATVLLYYGQELKSREVAQIMGCSDQQVRSRLSYARKQLRQLLPAEYTDEPV